MAGTIVLIIPMNRKRFVALYQTNGSHQPPIIKQYMPVYSWWCYYFVAVFSQMYVVHKCVGPNWPVLV